MKIAVTFLGKRGGGGRYALELAAALARRTDCTTHLLLAAECALGEEFERLALPTLTLETYETIGEFALRTVTRNQTFRQSIEEYLRTHGIDVLIMAMIHPWSPLAVRAAKRAGVRVISVVHEPSTHRGDGALLGAIMGLCIADCVRQSDERVTLTQVNADVLARQYQIASPRVIPLGTFTYHAATAPRALPAERPVRLLFFGRIAPYKGLDVLLAALAVLQIRHPELALEIWGDGNVAPYADRLEAVRNVRLENRWIDETEVESIFRRCDICVLPYLQASQSGVIGIALAAGMPVVALPEPGIVEQLAGGGGLIAQDKSAQSLARCIESLLHDPDRYQATSRAAIERGGPLGWPPIAARFADIAADLTGAITAP